MEDERQYEYKDPDSKREPAPEEPADVEPASEEPADVEPASEEPADVEPTPEEPADVEPAPEEPTVMEPADMELEIMEKEPEAADGESSGESAECCGEPAERCGEPDSGSGQRFNYREEYRQTVNFAYNQPDRQSNMALASLIMGIIGIVTSCCCYGGFIFGSLGIIFALLSKIGDTMEGYAKAGLMTSIIALVLAVLAMIVLFGIISYSLLSGGAY